MHDLPIMAPSCEDEVLMIYIDDCGVPILGDV